jgi:hypothetical protein
MTARTQAQLQRLRRRFVFYKDILARGARLERLEFVSLVDGAFRLDLYWAGQCRHQVVVDAAYALTKTGDVRACARDFCREILQDVLQKRGVL